MLPLQGPVAPGAEVAGYRVESLVARGGMGVVYTARDVRLDRVVALKVLAPELADSARFRERFIRETRLAASVDHPHIIPIHEAGEAGGLLYLVMRHVPGEDLQSALQRTGPMPLDAAAGVLRQVASALDAAHAAGLVHRDVKPRNVLLTGDVLSPQGVHAYLTDFGLTKKSTSVSGLTTTGHFLGTLDYIAPEQLRGQDVDARADVYALACTAYALLTGHPPFEREDEPALLWAQVYEPPPSLADERPDLPVAVVRAVRAGMAKEREQRPPSCGALVEPLQQRPPARVPGHPGRAAPVSPGPGSGAAVRTGPARRPAGRGRARALLLALPVALALGAAGVFLPRLGGPPEAALVVHASPDLPYAMQVPQEWRARTYRAGDSSLTVLAPLNLTALFAGDAAAAQEVAAVIADDPDAVVGVTAYHRPVLGSSPADRLETTEALLPGEAALGRQEEVRAGQLTGHAMVGTTALPDGTALQVRALALATEPPQLLVLFAPPSVSAEWAPTLERVEASLTVAAP